MQAHRFSGDFSLIWSQFNMQITHIQIDRLNLKTKKCNMHFFANKKPSNYMYIMKTHVL